MSNEKRNELRPKGIEMGSVGLRITREARLRAVDKAMNTMAAQKVADVTSVVRKLTIEDFRRMTREECSKLLEIAAPRTKLRGRTYKVPTFSSELEGDDRDDETFTCASQDE